MTLPRSVADVVAEHVTFEIECIDRMYLNVYVPRAAVPGQPGRLRPPAAGSAGIESTAPLAKITDRVHHGGAPGFARDQGVPWVDLRTAAAELSDEVAEALATADTFAEAIAAIVAPWRRLLVENDFALGCPFAATVVDSAAESDELRGHVDDLFAQWRASVAQVYVDFGELPAAADEQSTVVLSALEGALILARARRSIEPLEAVERYFATRPPGGNSGDGGN